jgi:hypothetical protein
MPRFGPVKRRDLIEYLRLAGFEGPFSAQNTRSCRKAASHFESLIHIKGILAVICWHASCAKLALIGTNGKNSRGGEPNKVIGEG